VALLVATLAASLAVVAAPAGAAGTGTVPLTTFSNLAVDPASGRVFLSGDNALVAYSPDGALLGSITDLPGAGGMAFSGGRLWLAQTTDASIAEIDPVTLTKVDEHPTNGPVSRSIVALGGKLFFTGTYDTGKEYPLQELDPATDAVSFKGWIRGSLLATAPGSSTRLFAGPDGGSNVVFAYDLAPFTATELGWTNLSGGNLRGLAVTDADTILTAAGAPYRFDEVHATPDGNKDLLPTGTVYDADAYPVAVAASSAAGGVFAGATSSSDLLWVFRQGVPVPTHRVQLPGSPLPRGLALSADASRAYTVSRPYGGAVKLTLTDLAPTVTGTSPTTVPAGQTTTVVVTGTGLGTITRATVGGTPVAVASDGTNRLEVELRTALPAGPTTLQLDGAFGDLTIPLTVTEPATGVVTATARVGSAPAAGATVTLVEETGTVRTATADAGGVWAFDGVPTGSRVDLTVTKGPWRRTWPDQVLSGTGPWRYDADLRAASAPTPRRQVELPPGTVRRVLRDPATGRILVAVGDEVVAFDADGRQVARIPGLWTASDLQVVGTTLYVLGARSGTISVIDLPTMTRTRSVQVPRLTTGSLAIAGGRAYVGDDDNQWMGLAAVDLTTGAATEGCACNLHTPTVVAVDGAPNRLVTSGAYGTETQLWDATAPVLASVASHAPPSGSDGEVVTSSAADRAWTAKGTELVLSTMTPTATAYPAPPTARSVARSAGRGGVLAFDQVVARQGTPTATHVLPAAPAPRSSALDASGDRSYVGTSTGHLVVTDLAPVVAAVTPSRVATTPGPVTVTGFGLGAPTNVTVDGTAVAHTVVDAGTLTVTLPALAGGDHQIIVTTAWGASSPVAFRSGPAHHPFSSWTALVTRVHTDLAGTPPTAGTRASWTAALTAGTKTPGDLVEALRRGPDNTAAVDPVARLYRAFLGRTPDAGGLRFWVQRKRAGTWTVSRMADQFAASSEFQRTYGTLTNRQFVTRIYTDVLGRAADPSGVTYWTGKLDRRERTRGQVMIGFSESSEYRRKQAENTDVAVVYAFLLGRAPTAGEATLWTTRQRAGTPVAVLAGELLASPGYATRIAG
jgi:hypothetical protein